MVIEYWHFISKLKNWIFIFYNCFLTTTDNCLNGYSLLVVMHFPASDNNYLLSTSYLPVLTPFFSHWITCKDNWLWEYMQILWISPEAFSTDPNKVLNSCIHPSINYHYQFPKMSCQNIPSFHQDALLNEVVIFSQFDVKRFCIFSSTNRNSFRGLDLNPAKNLHLRLLIALWLKLGMKTLQKLKTFSLAFIYCEK